MVNVIGAPAGAVAHAVDGANRHFEVEAGQAANHAEQQGKSQGVRWRFSGRRFLSGAVLALGGGSLIALGAMGCRGRGPLRDEQSVRYSSDSDLFDTYNSTLVVNAPGPYVCGRRYPATRTECFTASDSCDPPEQIMSRHVPAASTLTTLCAGSAMALAGLGLMASSVRRS